MRLGTGIGLLALLMGVALTAYIWSQHTGAVVKKGREARDQSNQISGRGSDGAAASSSVKLDTKLKDGKIDALLVTDVTAGGALDEYFGLQKGDEIIQVGDTKVKDQNDDQLSAAMVYEAAQRGQSITVRRAGQAQPVVLAPKGPLQGKIPMH